MTTAQAERIHGRFIPGLCRIWCRRRDSTQWFKMSYPHRGWSDCVDIVDHYSDHWGDLYVYEITTDSDLARPRG